VRDVQSLAMAQFDIDLDHRIVSVVQIEDDSTDAADTTAGSPAGMTGTCTAESITTCCGWTQMSRIS
jgi:hypothetical protein